MQSEPPAACAADLPTGGEKRKLLPNPTARPAVDRTRCRLFVGFPEGQLRAVSQAAALFPGATSIQLPRSVDCVFESPAEAAAVSARLQTEVSAGRLTAAELVYAERPQAHATGRRTVLRDMRRLHVRGIQRTVTVLQLRQLFTGCDDVTIPGNNSRGNNGYAFVQFPDRESAAAVMAQQLKLQDKQLTVSYAVERDMQRVGDPNFELVEIEDDPGSKRTNQSLSGRSTGDAGKKSATNAKRRKKNNAKAGNCNKNDVYKNHSEVLST